MSDILITLGLIVLVGLGTFVWFLIQCFFADRRTTACKTSAEALGLDFEAANMETIERETVNFQLMHQGHSREYRNVTSAVTDDVTIRLFDYKFERGSGRQQKTYYQTVAMLRFSEFELPAFHAKPEGLLEQLCALVGYQDIDFDHHQAFSNAFKLTSDVEVETREFFHQSLLDFFASTPKITFESIGNSFLFYELKHSVKPGNLGPMLEDAYRIYGLLRDRSAAISEATSHDTEVVTEAVFA